MQRKKATIYYGGFLGTSGGAFMHAQTFGNELNNKGWHIDIVTLDRLPLVVRYLPHLLQYLVNMILPPMGFFCKDRLTRRLYRFFFDTDVVLRVFEDVYLSWNSDVPSVCILHAVWSDNLQALSINEKQHRRLVSQEAKIIKAIEHPVITVSKPYLHYLQSDLFADYSLPAFDVIPLGLDLSSFDRKDNVQRKAKSIIYCGSLEARKNVFFLIEVFKRLYSIDREYTLTIIGDGPDRSALQANVDENQLPVRFLGRLDHADVLEELARHDIYLHTSVKESFSFSLLEAKLSGLRTCAYGRLEVPHEFIDIPMGSFDIESWCHGIISMDTNTRKFDRTRFSSKIMTEETLSLVRTFYPDFSSENRVV